MARALQGRGQTEGGKVQDGWRETKACHSKGQQQETEVKEALQQDSTAKMNPVQNGCGGAKS